MNGKSNANLKNVVLALVLAAFAWLVFHYWTRTWDDAAITLAFSRNLAKYGDLIPSQYSDRVEGFSTFLWMLIHAIFFRLGLGENETLFLAKALSTALTSVNILFFWRLVNEKLDNSAYQIMALLLFAVNVQTVTSAVFGMETALYATLVMLSYLLYRKKKQSWSIYMLFTLVASLLIFIRHEGVLFLLPFVVDHFIASPKRFVREPFIYAWAFIFLAYQTWHFSFFGEILTNPMIAKAQWPYRAEFSSLGDVLLYYSDPFVDLIVVNTFLFALLGIYFVRFGKSNNLKSLEEEPQWRMINWIALTGVFVMLITGGSWKAAERLSYPALPFLLLALFRWIDRIPFSLLVLNSKRAIAVTVFAFVFNEAAIFISFFINPQFNITVDGVRAATRVVTPTQEYLQRDVIAFAGPDMGGLLLFEGDGKRIIDIGLLCNAELAKNGYARLDQYLLREERPEIIEIHDLWVEPFLTSGLFIRSYFPVKVITDDGISFLFFRQDILAGIGEPDELDQSTLASETSMRPALHAILSKYDNFMVLDLQGLQLTP